VIFFSGYKPLSCQTQWVDPHESAVAGGRPG
jgi:hypothetical protein